MLVGCEPDFRVPDELPASDSHRSSPHFNERGAFEPSDDDDPDIGDGDHQGQGDFIDQTAYIQTTIMPNDSCVYSSLSEWVDLDWINRYVRIGYSGSWLNPIPQSDQMQPMIEEIVEDGGLGIALIDPLKTIQDTMPGPQSPQRIFDLPQDVNIVGGSGSLTVDPPRDGFPLVGGIGKPQALTGGGSGSEAESWVLSATWSGISICSKGIRIETTNGIEEIRFLDCDLMIFKRQDGTLVVTRIC